MNKVILMGNLTKDPELKQTPTGQTVANFSIATNKKWKDQSGVMQEKTEFHNIIAWRNTADIIGRFARKGKRIMVEGELQTRSWDGKDGKKIYKTEVLANNINIIDFPPKEENAQNQDINVTKIPF